MTNGFDYLSSGGMRFGEMNVIVAEPRVEPKIKIRDDFEWVTDKGRREMNAWLLEMFGTRDVSLVPKGTAFMLHNQYLVMRPEMAAILRNVS